VILLNTTFLTSALQRSVIQRQLGYYVFQLPVLVFQLLQFLGFATVHPSVLRLPAVVSLLRDVVLPAEIRRRQSCFALLQDRDNLLFAVSCSLHAVLLPGSACHLGYASFRDKSGSGELTF
jgi:hypothetical protein